MQTLIGLILIGFPLSILAPALGRRFGPAWLAAYPTALFFLFSLRLGQPGESISSPWMPSLGFDFSFRTDPLSTFFGWTISGIGVLVLLFASDNLAGKPTQPKTLGLLIFFMASMLGLALADHVITLYLFWEFTSVSSFLLIGVYGDKLSARKAAFHALVVTSAGGLCLLAGLLLLCRDLGSFHLSTLLSTENPKLSIAGSMGMGLILIGCLTKSALVPFHRWLPGAMEAPTPVSAYLHSATMVKAGIFLMLLLGPLWPEWARVTLGALGAITTMLGAWRAWQAADLKQVLAYTTIATLGTLTMSIALGPSGWKAVIAVWLAHTLYKAALFMTVGTIEKQTGSRNLDSLQGLRNSMRWTHFAAISGCSGLAALPPLFSFVAKESALEAMAVHWPLFAVLVISSTFQTAIALRIGWGLFAGPSMPTVPIEAKTLSLVGPTLLGLLTLLTWLALPWLSTVIISPILLQLTGEPGPTLAIWHGFNLALMGSFVAWVAGFFLYRWKPRPTPTESQQAGFQAEVGRAIRAFAEWVADHTQNRRLRSDILATILLATVAAGYGLFASNLWNSQPQIGDLQVEDLAIATLILGGAAVAVRSFTRISAVMGLGASGLGIALLYLVLGGPDLAMTQFAVESLTAVLFVLVFYHLPRITWKAKRKTRTRDALIAIAFGTVMGVITYSAHHVVLSESVSSFYAERSLPDAHGRNVLNVILVDFRALDTFGEITVLALAAIGVVALMRLRPRQKEEQSPL